MKLLSFSVGLFCLLSSSPAFSQIEAAYFDAPVTVCHEGDFAIFPNASIDPTKIQARNGGESRLRASRHNLWPLDEPIFITDSTLYTYDDKNRVVKMEYLYQDSTGGWPFYRKDLIDYDIFDNILEYTTFSWEGSSWVNFIKTQFTYNGSNQVTSRIKERWNNNVWTVLVSEAWEYDLQGRITLESTLEFRILYTYDSNGNQVLAVHQRFKDGVWKDFSRTLTTYNAQNQIVTELNQYGENAVWWDSSLRQNEYDANGNMISSSASIRQPDGTWKNSNKQVYSYDAESHLLSHLRQWGAGSDWQNDELSQFEYNASGNRISRLFQVWDSITWKKINRETYDYDLNNKIVFLFQEIWENGIWKNQLQQWYSYNTEGNETNSLKNLWINNAWIHKSQTTHTYDLEGHEVFIQANNWVNDTWVKYFEYYYYYEQATGIQALKDQISHFEFFPNPATTHITLKMDISGIQTARIFDLNGRQMFEQELHLNESKTLNFTGIPSGQYILQVLGIDGKKAATPFVIEK